MYIRVDGGVKQGLGHLVRCMALGHMLEKDFDIYFYCLEIPVTIKDEIVQQGFVFEAIEEEEQFITQLTGKEIVVLDHYNLNYDYQKGIKNKGCTLICIDDLHEKKFFADLIINHSPGVHPNDYKAPAFSQYALGPIFALLRPPFLGTGKRKIHAASKESVLINFGGSDFRNLTAQTLEVVLEFKEIKKINVVTGAGYIHYEKLTLLGEKTDKISFYQEVGAEKMAQLISESDISIIPSSGVLLEALAVGNYIVSGMYVDNQKRIFENFKKLNVFYSAEDFSTINIKRAIENCLSEVQHRDRVIDGESRNRISKIFKQLLIEKNIHLRKAEFSDLSITFRWACDKSVRAYSFNQEDITMDGHAAWFLSKISQPHCFYFLAEFEGKVIGSIRFDIVENEAIISFLIDPGFHNRGFGVSVLKKGLETIISENNHLFKKIIGYVMPENIASCKTFERFRFTKNFNGKNYLYTQSID